MGGNGGETGEWSFTIPCLPPSVNALHNVIYSQRRVELKPEVRRWRSDCGAFIPRINLESKESLIRVDVVFYYPHFYKNGRLRRFDTHNVIKPLFDVIAEKAGFDDSRIKSGSWDSFDAVDERVEIRLRELGTNGRND